MSSTQFTADLEDIQFVLFEQLDIDEHLSKIDAYADFDQETYVSMLEEAYRVATEVLSPLNGPSDKGCTFEGDGRVITPPGFGDAWRTMAESGWVGMSAPQSAGGIGLPYPMVVACNELFNGAATAFSMYIGLTAGAARVVLHKGPKGKATEYAERMFSGEWAGTMCLTEAGAGTSVGDNRCKANRTKVEGTYLLEGEKIFISGGDNDFTSNIIHLVLARTPDAPAGSKGISLFIVPKFLVHDDGTLGDRNDAFVVGIEHKMGINGSATCTIALGANGPCEGYLIGDEGEGLRIMFALMNEARIGVGAQGQALAAAAYQYATAYAKDRIQGTSLSNVRDADAPRVAIVEHPDVRRMLLDMKVHVETMRSLCYRIAYWVNMTEGGHLDEAEHKKLSGRSDLLVPVVKAHCTDKGFEVAVTGIQVLGGYGYISEYPLEQCVRDAKIMSIYEGTNGVQALDLMGRKMRIGGGALFMEWMQWAQGNISGCADDFPDAAASLVKSIQHLGASAMHLGGLGMKGKIDEAMAHATTFQRMFGVVALGLEALDQARVAKSLIDGGTDTPHLRGKKANLSYYTTNVLPQAVAMSKTVQSGDTSCLDDVLFR